MLLQFNAVFLEHVHILVASSALICIPAWHSSSACGTSISLALFMFPVFMKISDDRTGKSHFAICSAIFSAFSLSPFSMNIPASLESPVLSRANLPACWLYFQLSCSCGFLYLGKPPSRDHQFFPALSCLSFQAYSHYSSNSPFLFMAMGEPPACQLRRGRIWIV
jgi:hypothetical protein